MRPTRADLAHPSPPEMASYAPAAIGAAIDAGCAFFVRRFAPFAGVAVFFAGLIPSFFAFRASRYFLIFVFATSLCFAHTIPKTGAAGFLQPGTGQNCFGGFFRAFLAIGIGTTFAGRPGRRTPRAVSTA